MNTCLKPLTACILGTVSLLLTGNVLGQNAITKTDTATMNKTADWTGSDSGAPDATDLGVFDSTISAFNATNVVLGGNISLLGLVFDSNLNGPVRVNSDGNALTLGTNGVNTSSANNTVTLNCNVQLAGSNVWACGSQTVYVGGVISDGGQGYGLYKTGGSGSLTLIGSTNTYTGLTILDSGYITIGDSNGTGSTNGILPGDCLMLGGQLRFRRTELVSAPYVVGGSIDGPGTIRLGTGAVQLNQSAGTHSIGNVVANPGTALVYAGSPEAVTVLSISQGSAVNSLQKFISGVWMLNGGGLGANFEMDGGSVVITNGSGNCYLSQSGQTFTVHGGQWLCPNLYGLRMGSTYGASTSGGNFTGLQDGGMVTVWGGGSSGSAELGNNSSGKTVSFTLSGGTLSVSNQNFNIGSAGDGSSTTTLTLTNRGKLSVGGTLRGVQGAGAQQVFAFNGGTLVADNIDATYLSAPATPAVQGALQNNGGTLAPGDLGLPGLTSIVGDFSINAGALAIDIGGPTAAGVFQDATLNSYDNVTVSGNAVLGGTLNVSFINGYQPAGGEVYTIVTANGGLSGAFSAFSLPSLPVGESWNVVQTGTSLSLQVIPQFAIGSVTLSGTNLVIVGTHGEANGGYTVLTSTNVALPLSHWVANTSGTFDGNGDATITIPARAAAPAQFFILREP